MTLDLGLFKRQRYTIPSIQSYGGNVITGMVLSSGISYAVHVFTASGLFTLPLYLSTTTAQVLVVGGGGGGGGNGGGGGGGGGGVIDSSTYTLSPGFPYAVEVGAGGTPGVNAGVAGGTGGTSTFHTLVAIGGGGGGSGNGSYYIGGSGGSGGGGASTSTTVGAGGAGTAGQGFAGGAGLTNGSYRSGGGGGGAGAPGTAAAGASVSGSGGNGTFTTILSITTAISIRVGQYVTATNAIYFAGGGAGGPSSGSTSIVGSGGGGLQKTSGKINTGGGGGGAGSAGNVGTGGSGIVIIRYPVPNGVSAADTNLTDPYFKNTSLLLSGAIFTKVNQTQWPIELLLVAGGGGGGTGASINDYSGGGGAGGVVTTSTLLTQVHNNVIYYVQVGAGGFAGATSSNGTNGGNSSITATSIASIIALGGGYGSTKYTDGGAGGSGGGAGIYTSYNPGASQPGGAATQPASASGGFGFGGGVGFNYNWGQSGGGGGAGSVGEISGGNGKYIADFSAYGESGYFASGGAGVIAGIGSDSMYKIGGGGGFASNARWGGSNTVPRAALTATGGGGAIGMPGGSGTVIIRHPTYYGTAIVTGNPVTTSTGVYTYYQWTTSGTFQFISPFTTHLLTLPTNDSFIDSSANALTITPTGTPAQGTFTPFGRNWNWSTLLGYGTYGYQTLPANIQYDITGADFTIEFWANFITWNTMDYSGMQMFTTFEQGSGWATGWNGGVGSNMFFQTILNGATQTSIDTTGIMPGTNFQLGTWNHFTVMQKTNVIYFYLNGIMTYSAAAPIVAGTGDRLAIGVYQQNFDYAGNPNFYLSNSRIVKGTAVYSTTTGFTPSIVPLTSISNTVLLIHQSNSSVDNSPLNSTITNIESGTAPSIHRFSLSTQGYTYNSIINSGSIYFNESSVITVSSSTAFSFGGSANFTVEAWVYWPAVAASTQTYIEFNGTTRLIIGRTSTGFRLYNNGTERGFTYNFGPLGTWYHLAVVRKSGFISVYINGTLANTPYADTTAWSHTVANIGRNYDAAEPMIGYVANLRVVTGVAAYMSNFTSPDTPVKLIEIPTPMPTTLPPSVTAYLWGGGGGGGQAGGWSYGSAAGGGGAAQGVISVTPTSTYYITAGGSGKVSPAAGVRAAGGGGTPGNNSDNRYGGGGGGYSAIFNNVTASQGAAILMAGGGGGGGSSRAGTGNVGGAGGGTSGQTGTAAYDSQSARRGGAGTQTGSIAGTGGGAGSALLGGSPGTNSYGGAGGGGYWGGGGGGYAESNTMGGGGGGSGYINTSSVTAGVLTTGTGVTPGNSASALRGTAGVGGAVATEGSSGTVVIMYADTYSPILTTGNPTVSVSGGFRTYKWISSGTFTIALAESEPNITSTQTSLLLNSSNIGIIDHTMFNNVIAVGSTFYQQTLGSTLLSTAVVKYNSHSMYFNGSESHLIIPTNPAFSFSTGNFTVECWIYATVANDSPIYESRTEGSGTTGFTLTAFSSSVIRIYTGSSAIIASTGTTYLNTWTHVAVVRSGVTTTLYINGMSAGTSAGMGTLTDQSVVIGGGRYTGTSAVTAYFTGYIDDFRITKGVARYTADFILPQASPKLK